MPFEIIAAVIILVLTAFITTAASFLFIVVAWYLLNGILGVIIAAVEAHHDRYGRVAWCRIRDANHDYQRYEDRPGYKYCSKCGKERGRPFGSNGPVYQASPP